jgi:hypothetical protein
MMDHIVFWLFGMLSALGLTGYFFQLVAVRSKLDRKQKTAKSLQDMKPLLLSPISVIKPLKGLVTIVQSFQFLHPGVSLLRDYFFIAGCQ